MEKEKKDKKEKGFTVIDKRVSAKGANDNTSNRDEKRLEDVKEEYKRESKKQEEKQDVKLPPIDFAAFILSLNTSATISLGDLPNPQTGKTQIDLQMAKQTIDILGIIQEKTKGNLTDREDQLLKEILYNLRMRYLEKVSLKDLSSDKK